MVLTISVILISLVTHAALQATSQLSANQNKQTETGADTVNRHPTQKKHVAIYNEIIIIIIITIKILQTILKQMITPNIILLSVLRKIFTYRMLVTRYSSIVEQPLIL